jgi:hypothetical protein
LLFAANAALRAAITPAGRGSKARSRTPERPLPKHAALNWAWRLKRVFGIDIEQCARCGGRLLRVASIEEPERIERILAHRRERGGEEAMTVSLGARAPPQASRLRPVLGPFFAPGKRAAISAKRHETAGAEKAGLVAVKRRSPEPIPGSKPAASLFVTGSPIWLSS